MKELKIKNTESHIYKPKQERRFKVVLKYMPPEEDVDEIKNAIEEFGHTVTNIWNIMKRDTKVPLDMFYVEIKPVNNNKGIY